MNLRELRQIPESAIELSVNTTKKSEKATIYYWVTDKNRVVSRQYRGEKPKHCGFYAHHDMESCINDANKWIAMYQRIADDNAARRKEVSEFVRDVKVGDILYGSWGWEQTNCDFYQVIELVGKKSVKIQRIGDQKTYSSSMSGDCVPVPDKFIGEAITKVYGYYGAKIDNYLTVNKWDGLPKYWSSYA